MPLLGMILPWWARWAGIALLVAAVFGFGWFKGNDHGTEKLNTYIQKVAQEATRIAVKRTAITEMIITQYVTKTVPQTQVVTNTVENEVIRYVDANPTGMCIDPTFIRLHNNAALNAISESPASAP